MTVVETSDLDEIERIVADNPKVVVDFGAESWCVPCRRLRPHYDAAAGQVDAVLVRADIDDNPELARKYNILGVPTLLAYVDGEPVGDVRSRTAVALVNEINNL